MDPAKNFDHLDPKLKDTYARVMGTAPAGTPQNPVGQPPPANPAAAPANQFASAPGVPVQNQNMGPNPGTGPTVTTVPTDTSTVVAQPGPDTNSPATSSFFSNPSPATANPTQAPVQAGAENNLTAAYQASEPSQMPVTPYTGDNQQAPAVGAMPEPLPSPSSIAQNTAKEASPLLRVLYIIAAVIFFAIYTVFWIKVFNLPFLF